MNIRKKAKYPFINPYKLETELCDSLIQYAKFNGWQVYPEIGGWDILLVRDNFQIGIQAKLQANLEVLAQTIKYRYNPQPDLCAVLVPTASIDFEFIAQALHIHVIRGAALEPDLNTWQYRWVKKTSYELELNSYNKNFLTNPTIKCWVPEVEIVLPAGVPSPKGISKWKIQAIKICLLLEQQGYITSADFRQAKIGIGLWIDKWIVNSGEKIGKLAKYIRKPVAILPHELYPEIYLAIKKLQDI